MTTIIDEVNLNGLLDIKFGNDNMKTELNTTTPPNELIDDNMENDVKTMIPAAEEKALKQELNDLLENNIGNAYVKSEHESCTSSNGLEENNIDDKVQNMISAVGENNLGLEPKGLLETKNGDANSMSDKNANSPSNELLEKIGEEELRPSPIVEVNAGSFLNGLRRNKSMENNVEKIFNETQIKVEDPLEIDESLRADGTKRMPIISLTPTSKLLATPNPTNPKRKFVCPYENCGKSYGKSSHLRSHLTWHTGIKPFVCQEPNCGKGFTRSDELNRHVRTHTGEKPFECVQCTKKFSRSDHLTKHLATHAKQQRAPRRKVNNIVETKAPKPPIKRNPKRRAGADIAYGNLRPYASTVNRRIDSSDNLNTREFLHLDYSSTNITKHQPIKIKLERPDNNSEYQIVPTSILKNNAALKEIKSNNDEEDVNSELIIGDDEIMPEANADPLTLGIIIKNEPEDTKMNILTPPYACEQCSQTFQTMPDLNCHRKEHANNVETLAIENKRSHQGLNPQLLQSKLEPKAPQMIKDPERPYSCKECPKTFRRHDDLQRHFRTHTGEKPFPCNECDRRFVRSDHLKKHLQTHIRVRSTQFNSLNGPTKKNS